MSADTVIGPRLSNFDVTVNLPGGVLPGELLECADITFPVLLDAPRACSG